VLAEHLVAQSLGIANGSVREEWAAYDLEARDKTKIEVKSAAFIQSWQRKELSRISFNVSKKTAWDRETNKQGREPVRTADVYVFALLAHKDQGTINPLDVSQWELYVLPTKTLDKRKRSQHSITLPSLRKLTSPVKYFNLNRVVAEAAKLQKKSA